MKRPCSKSPETSEKSPKKVPKRDASPTRLPELLNVENDERIKNWKVLKTKSGNEYKIHQTLGEGVFGIVFEVSDKNGQKSAAKVIKAQEEHVDLWRTEYNILHMIEKKQHKNVLHLIGYEQLSEFPPICSENVLFTRILGSSLMDVVTKAQKQLPEEQDLRVTFSVPAIRKVGYQICEGMLHLESLGIFHLDLKPENIYFFDKEFELKPDQGDVKFMEIVKNDLRIQIGDFGCSKTEDSERHQDDRVQTQNYRAPEIFLGLPYSYKSDVWSMGAIMVEMYTGLLLFYGTENVDTEEMQWELMQNVMKSQPSTRMWREATRLGTSRLQKYTPSKRRRSPRVPLSSYRMKRLPTKSAYGEPLHFNCRDSKGVKLFEFVANILIFDPANRPSFEQILEMPFFEEEHKRAEAGMDQ